MITTQVILDETSNQLIVGKRVMIVTVMFKIEWVQYLKLTIEHLPKK